MQPPPDDSHMQQDFIRLSGPPDGSWRQRSGGGPVGRGRRSGHSDSSPYLQRRTAGHWDRRADRWDQRGRPGAGRPTVPLVRSAESASPAGCPWMKPGKKYSRGVVGLHEEIEDFFQHMSPSVDEHHLRSAVFDNIRDVIHNLWCEAQVFIFGSFETGLYLPTSDIDVVVIGKWRGSPLEMLKDALIAGGICSYDSVKVLDKAAVPIIKLTDRRSQIKVDISFNMSNGLVSANRIKELMAEFPHLPRLVMVLKQFLLQRELNEVFTGGVSSYGVILMVVSFLQTHERYLGAFPGCNLGVLLIEFFELYGIKFNYHKTCIRVRGGGYAPRREVEEQFVGQSAHSSPLCIEDPHNPTNDIGRSSYHVMKVKEAFRYAYHKLRFSVLAPGKQGDPNRARVRVGRWWRQQRHHMSLGTNPGILGRIITVADEMEDFRRWIRSTFPSPEPAGVEPASWPEVTPTVTPGPQTQAGPASNGVPGSGPSPASESDSRSPTPPPVAGSSSVPAPDSEQPRDQTVWWTEACRVAIKAKERAARNHKNRGSQDSFMAFKKARAHARRVVRKAKEAAGVNCGGERKEAADGESATPAR